MKEGGNPVKQWLAVLLTLMLLFSSAAAEEPSLEQLLPLADAAAAAAMEQPEGLYCGLRPLVTDVSGDGSTFHLLGEVYLSPLPLDQLSDAQYAQVQWLEQRALVELRRKGTAWEVSSFSLDAELDMEEAAAQYFMETMMEYMDGQGGFSIQYPAVFGEESITQTEHGLSGQIQGASFLVERIPNQQHFTLDTFLSGKKQETPGAETNINEHTGLGRLTMQQEGTYLVVMAMVTEDWIYQAELRYDQSLIRTFLHYGQYMFNSFTVDEMGHG